MPPTQHTVTGRRLGYLPALDGLRALAALTVVAFHARIVGFRDGDVAVDLLFVLSGFLITSILISRAAPMSSFDYRDFYRRRATRLMPPYLAVIASCVVLAFFTGDRGVFVGAAASSVYAANWALAVTGFGFGTLTHLWSLSVEEQFYLMWPAALALILRRCNWRAAPVLSVVGALAFCSWLTIVVCAVLGVPWLLSATFTRAIEQLFGCLLAIYIATPTLSGPLTRCLPRSAISIAGLAAGLLLIAFIPISGLSPDATALAEWPVTSGLACVLIYACLRGAPAMVKFLSSGVLTAIGKRSYGIYLWHFPVIVTIDEYWGLNHWLARIVGIAVTAVLVTVSYRFIETPFLQRNRVRRIVALEPRRIAAPVAVNN
jgi:peptidoglycan/LPS O-acetylase OafA/YrhL